MPSSNVTMLNAEQHLRTEVTHSAEFFPEDNANSRVYSARRGIPGFYVVDINPTESVYFKTEVFVRNDNGRRVFKVLPVSHWVNGQCVGRAQKPERGEWAPYLPGCVLHGKLDFGWLPEKHYDYLEGWADLILDGVDRFDAMNPPRPRRPCSH